ncbi:hypothetical protein BDV95DRAFT_501469 [Massariosphaeria phaeospora]|uniref:Helix-turn-helix domain-containing protein n=1 Tax=Massariosphaeria phaeospora TaxID=100035 RepID=A0A7C8I153_9PLEO|nr:hypothetical protein BDV95DRAFT_501469 [Massariosphaeria phaeospora]
MGSSTSKGARAAGAGARKYPTRSPNSTTRPATPAASPSASGPTVHPPPQAYESRTPAVDTDARDPGLASRLNTLGAVQPNPHYSASSTSAFDPQRRQTSESPFDMMTSMPQSAYPDPRENPALRLLEARRRIQEEAEEEMINAGRRGFQGRKYVDVGIIQMALMRQQRGEVNTKIEDVLGVKRGRLDVLGKGVVKSIT